MKYKGILHAHSTYSYDGKLSLSELRNFLVERGIHFACMSEHTDELSKERAEEFVAECRTLSDEKFVFVPGFEVPYQRAHILLLGTDAFLTQFADMDSLAAWSKQAALTVLAHPVRNRFKLDEVMEQVIGGVEIWNQQYEGKWAPRTRSVKLLRTLRNKRPSLFATGGIDFHREEHFGNPVTFVELDLLTEAGIKDALTAGNFSFGNSELEIQARALWRPKFSHRTKSLMAVWVITLGKRVNKILAKLGLSLPSRLRKQVRSHF